MPPKKILKTDPKQPKLSFFSAEKEQLNPDTVTDCNNNNIEVKNTRNFQTKWLQLYSWLRFDSQKKFMYCAICDENRVQCGMNKNAQNTNFRHSTLTRHADLPEHTRCLLVPQLQADLSAIRVKHSSEQDTAIKALFKTLGWIIQEDLPLSKFKSLVGLLHSFDVKDIDILHKSKINYESPVAVNDLLECLAEFAEKRVIDKLKESEFVTVLTDESTDVSNHKRQVIYAQVLNGSFCPETLYITNIECLDATGAGIAQSLLDEMEKRGVSAQKIMSLGSDGASAMTGKEKGAAAILRRSNPHMHNVHCVAHRLALCSSQAAEKIPILQKHQQILSDLFYYYKGSSKRESKLHAIQELLNDPKLTVKEIHNVRWLSYYTALTTIVKTLDSLLTYLSEATDPKALGLKKKMSTDSFISTSYLMMDAMAPVTILCQFFQTENIDVALLQVKLDQCKADLQAVCGLQTPYLKQLNEDLVDDNFKGHHITKTNFNLQKLAQDFTDNLLDNLNSRFPADDILSSFGVLGLRPISFLSKTDLEIFGNEEIVTLCKYFGEEKTVTWKKNDETETSTSGPIINCSETKLEWSLLKKVVLAEKYPRDKMSILWHLISMYHKDSFPNMLKLAALALTSAVHTAGCERGFSVQNRILNKLRNRLNVATQDKLMAVKLCSDVIDYDYVVGLWKGKKERRVYELK